MQQFAKFVIQIFTESGETVLIAKLINALAAELQRRAEYAIKFGIHAPALGTFLELSE